VKQENTENNRFLKSFLLLSIIALGFQKKFIRARTDSSIPTSSVASLLILNFSSATGWVQLANGEDLSIEGFIGMID
jgi:hypothetical protein|tara:strand:+ start:860 stop:1090 length:231 start_codon:yes stop_codon:yes gene_type:complete